MGQHLIYFTCLVTIFSNPVCCMFAPEFSKTLDNTSSWGTVSEHVTLSSPLS